jgi:hypothetical protein
MSTTCHLVDGFAIVVQVLMAILAFSSLLYKRHIEDPKRPILIWALDTSKQAIAASLVHISNIGLSIVSSWLGHREGNPCVWYFLNLALDTTVGVYLLYLFIIVISLTKKPRFQIGPHPILESLILKVENMGVLLPSTPGSSSY